MVPLLYFLWTVAGLEGDGYYFRRRLSFVIETTVSNIDYADDLGLRHFTVVQRNSREQCN